MKVSLNWLQDYLPLPQSHEEISDVLTALGLEASFERTGKSFMYSKNIWRQRDF